MADFEAPTFSLGLDLDADAEPRLPSGDHVHPILPSDASASLNILEDDADEFVLEQVNDSDLDTRPEPPRVLKRLRRAADKSSATKKALEKPSPWNDEDDDIEEFSSSEEKNEVDSSTQHHSVCSSSKIPLKGLGILTSQSSGQWNSRKKEQASDASASARFKATPNGVTFPKLTISPLRRFQLLDSDSDDSTDLKDTVKGAQKINLPSKDQQSTASDEKRKASVGTPQNDDLWKDFPQTNISSIPTPAFDEVCKEYFQSVKDKNAVQKLGQNFEQPLDLDDPLPPAHRYFFHADPRIQKLVRSRLPFFSPLGMANNRANKQPNVSIIDYLSQFNNGESSKKRGCQKGSGKNSSASRRNKSKTSNPEGTTPEGWIDPKSSGTVPKNAGKRRINASSGQSAGHWYTSPEGTKVYVNKNGKELSGQMAYRQYRKESGAGCRRSKKKSNAKKKKG